MALTRNIGVVDLDRETVTVQAVPAAWRERFVGGRGLGAYLAWRHIAAGGDPLGDASAIVVSAGLLAGTPLAVRPCASVLSLSPMSGRLTCTPVRGPFGAHLRWAGFDHLVIRGRAKKPVFLEVHNDTIAIRDAADLWGLSPSATRAALSARVGDDGVQAGMIGPAGEQEVRFAHVTVDGTPPVGRTGLGAVWGHARLKALACRSGRDLQVKFPQAALANGPGDSPPCATPGGEALATTAPVDPAVAAVAAESGMDAQTTALMVAWAEALFADGIIDRRHTRGRTLGDGDPGTAAGLATDIAARRAFGRHLAQGPWGATAALGLEHLERFPSAAAIAAAACETPPGPPAARSQKPAPGGPFPEVPGRLAEAVLLERLGACLGTDVPPRDAATAAAALRIVTGLSPAPGALTAAAYRAVALERLFHLRAANVVPPPARRGTVRADLQGRQAATAQASRADGWTRALMFKKRIFAQLGLADLWPPTRL